MRRRAVLRIASVFAVASLATGPLVARPAPAAAATNDQALSGTGSSMWQTNNNVEALAVSGGVLYAGGTFTRVRPPGAASGTNETTRTYLAAFNASTGALITSFNVTLNGAVNDLAVSPDGTRLYVVGAFTTVNGTTKNRIAALNIPAGTLVGSFTANANSLATAVDADASRVYVSGDFTTVNSTAKSRMVALNAANGAIVAGFTADLDRRANSVLIAPDGSRVLVGGNFTTVNGGAPSGMASVHPLTGAVQPWGANAVQPINSNCGGRVTDIVAQGTTAYVTAEGDPPGCYEGTYAANIGDGAMQWNSTCLGASLGLAILDNVLYKASHQHDCAFNLGGAPGGFVGGTSRDTFVWWRLLGQNLADGSFVHWSPNTNARTGSNPVGPHVLETDGTQMFVGGDFSHVDNQPQQGLARFGRGNNTTPAQVPTPAVQATKAGTLTVSWSSVIDRDNGTLTYRLFRDGSTTPISTQTVESYPWSRPQLRFDDTGLAPGSSHSYRVNVSDGTFTSTRSAAGSGTVAAQAPPAFDGVVTGDGPSLYWRLGDAAGTVGDSSPSGTAPGTAVGGVTAGQPGALTGNSAVTLDGSSGYLTSSAPLAMTGSFSESAWFRTTTVRGGSILATSTQPTGPGGTTDRAVTMDNNGNLVFSVKGVGFGGPFGPRLTSVRVQGPIYNDGRWHQVVATYDTATSTSSLYVDGRLSGTITGSAAGVTSAYQRVGYADLSAVQAVFGINFFRQLWPASQYFAGSIDEVAVYPGVLTAGQVAEQYAAGVAGGA